MNRTCKTRHARQGVALLTVLALIMAITVLSLGYLARSGTELACGHNMALRVQMDQAAASGLEHARGLILNPPENVSGDGYWTGATAQQLDPAGGDFYDVNVASDANDHCNYLVTCDAYRLENGEKIGRSTLSAHLRLDPCITFWLGTTAAIPQATVIKGDLYCGGNLANQGTIQGDVFAAGTISGTSPTGRASSSVASPPLAWPGIEVADYNPTYQVGQTSYSSHILATSTPSGTFEPYPGNPAGVRYRHADTTLVDSISITGLLVVNGDLRITASGAGISKTITAVQGFPALLVGGDLIVEPGGRLTVDGLAVIGGRVLAGAEDGRLDVTGGLLVANGFWETTQDASGNGRTGTIYGAPTWTTGPTGGALAFDGVDDYVDCGNDAGLAITDRITVAAWVKTNEVGNGQHNPFVTKGDRTYALKHGPDSSITFFIYDPVAKWQAAEYAVSGSFNGQWHHVAGTYDGNDVKLYVDGIEKSATPFVGTINNLSFPLNIGRNAQEADRFYGGAVDEVRIYNRVLDAAEILQLHADPGALGDPSDLRARYQFNAVGADVNVEADPASAAMVVWDWDAGDMDWKGQHWGTAVDAFFKSVQRQ
ncbi:MAG: LamG domain-containing protein [Planctomycetota bacterium]|jgi:hypothetical protein